MASRGTNSKALSSDLSESTLRRIKASLEADSKAVENVVDSAVRQICRDLDELIGKVESVLKDEENPPTTEELEIYVMKLPIALYYVGDKKESVGIKEDIAKAIKDSAYNEAFAKSIGTVSDKKAIAESKVQEEYLAQLIFQRVYKKLGVKMDYASELIQSIKKVVTRRIAEIELTRINPN